MKREKVVEERRRERKTEEEIERGIRDKHWWPGLTR